MNVYKGLRSWDAEIILDLEQGKATFDYSLNVFQEGNSNTSCVLDESGTTTLKKFIMIFGWAWVLFILMGSIIMMFLEIPFMFFPKYQYKWQKLLRWWNTLKSGMKEEIIIGKQSDTDLSFHLDNNIWFEYILDGDYNNKIKKISLLRKFVKKTHLGLITHQQDGWNLIFSFSEPPEYGHVVVKSIL